MKDHKILKKLQSLHEANFSEHEHWTISLENVPATAKQILPPFFPPFIPLKNSSTAARQIPSSATFSPPGSLPQFIYSQQFCFFETNSIIPIYLEIRGVANITNCEKTSKIKIDCSYPQAILIKSRAIVTLPLMIMIYIKIRNSDKTPSPFDITFFH